MKIVITGADGFVGRHVASIAAEVEHEVVGIAREVPKRSVAGSTSTVVADLTRSWPDVGQCDAVLHLAGRAAVGPSFDNPMAYIRDNASMVVNMCESLLASGGQSPRIVIVSSGAVYAPSAEAVTEESSVAFSSPYGVSKVLVENLAAYYRERGLDTVVARPFNHIGPGQAVGYLVPDLADKIRALPIGAELEVGNLSASRDYTDVRDVARAYLALCSRGALAHTTYNIASGTAFSGFEILDQVLATLNRERPTISAVDLRPIDNPVSIGDASRLRSELGWRPEIPVHESVEDALRAPGA